MIGDQDKLVLGSLGGGLLALAVLLMGGGAWLVLLAGSYLAWGDQFVESYRWRRARRYGLHLPPPGDEWI